MKEQLHRLYVCWLFDSSINVSQARSQRQREARTFALKKLRLANHKLLVAVLCIAKRYDSVFWWRDGPLSPARRALIAIKHAKMAHQLPLTLAADTSA